jgi:hypothetical protein
MSNRGKPEDKKSGDRKAAEEVPKIKDGLIHLKGFTEHGVSANCNFLIYREALETFAQVNHPWLEEMISDPFGEEYFVPRPKIKKAERRV